MSLLPASVAASGLVVWRLERTAYVADWARAEGSFRVGGRWSAPGRRVLYTSLDPATAILEVAVHKGFNTLDTVPHTLLAIEIDAACALHVVSPGEVPNPHWLLPIAVNSNQQTFGDALLAAHPVIKIPSAVSRYSWNVLVDVDAVKPPLRLLHSEPFALDTRLLKP